MINKVNKRESLSYIAISFLIIFVVVFALIFSNNQLELAYIHHDILNINWHEDIGERESNTKLFGLEKFGSLTYSNEGNFPALVTITTVKNLLMIKEDELRDKTIETIDKSLLEGIVVNKEKEIMGERLLKNGHKSLYIIYDGNDTTKNPPEMLKIIGEVWNCGTSHTSIICIGVAQITNNIFNDSEINLEYWKKIIRDEKGTFGIEDFHGSDGLLYNVVCH